MCLSPLGAARVDALEFQKDADIIYEQLLQTNEFRNILIQGENFPSSHFFDPELLFKKASLEGNYLDEHEFLQIAYAIETIVACKNFLLKSETLYPTLTALAKPIQITTSFAQEVFRILDDQAMVRDSASPELSRLRKKLRDEQSRLRQVIDRVYKQAIEQQWIPEGALPTIRDGRLAIPVLAEHKRKLKGFILDESATGQTVFMEPAEALEANNEIRDLEHAIRREVIRILRKLTDSLRTYLHEFQQAFHFLGQLDFIRAKAKLAITLQADLPTLEKKPVINWKQARHPLLLLTLRGKRDVVPLSIDLTEENRMLLVSGPNAGGKSVCLKTVGLLQYMIQCGLLVSAREDSVFGIFDNIFLDIGDQQSIENDLSTYSSHLQNMNHFITQATGKSLLLMDELGSGTDPNFGGAIAESILQVLLKKQVWGVATTHYYNLKLFAGNHTGIRNAAMRFDEKNLMPLYLLDIGKPGSSFALEIAKKTGLPDETLTQAKTIVGKELVGFETLIRNLEQEKNELSKKVSALEKKEAELKTLLARYETLTDELESKKKQIIDKAKQDAARMLKETNREIEKTIRHIRENQANKKETVRVRKKLEEVSKKVEPTNKPVVAVISGPVAKGDRVRMIGQDAIGTVMELKGKQALVELGELTSWIALTKLEKIKGYVTTQPTVSKPRSSGLSVQDKRATFNAILDVRGKRVEEALPELDQFIDTAILLGYGEVRILHGKGEGILRSVIRDHLRKYKQVAAVSDEHVERGGAGISVVVLK